MDPEPSFETDLRSLERIVDDLERGEADLAEALAKYEQGVRLLARCQGVLDQAERSVALLRGVDADGNPVVAAFDATATAPTEPVLRPGKSDQASATRRKRRAEPETDSDESQIPF
jgi:exodeoxyribonuclease VII small subunit